MRVLLKIVCFSFLSFAFIRCKKDIKEPSNFGNGKTKLYIKVDDTEYLFEDKVINLNKNVGSDLVIKEVDIEHNALGIYIEFSLHNKLLKDKKKSYYYSTNGYINIDPEGRWISEKKFVPNLFFIRGFFFSGSKSPISCSITHQKKTPNNLFLSDSTFDVLKHDYSSKKMALEYNTLFEDREDQNIPKQKHTLKLIIQYEK